MEKDQYLLSSTYNSLQILNLLSKKENLGLAEISKELKLGRATVFRMLYTLEKAGFVDKSPNAKYNLSIKFAHFGSLVVERQSIAHLAKPYLEKLRDTFQETAHLSILTSTGKMVFISKHFSSSSLQMISRIGEEWEAFYTASGKLMLAHVDQARAERYAEKCAYKIMTPNTIRNKEDLLAELAVIRERGYAVDNEEHEIGLVCFAAPIHDYNGDCVAAISISGPTSRMLARQPEILPALIAVSKDISRSMGCRNPD